MIIARDRIILLVIVFSFHFYKFILEKRFLIAIGVGGVLKQAIIVNKIKFMLYLISKKNEEDYISNQAFKLLLLYSQTYLKSMKTYQKLIIQLTYYVLLEKTFKYFIPKL